MKRSTAFGFTLIEMMIVIAVVALLTALAVPSYRDFVIRSNRTEAINELLNLAACQERIYQKLNAYDATDRCGLNGSATRATPNGLYSITMATQNTNQNFVITATASGSQTNDSCGNLTYSDRGVKDVSTSADAAKIATCWKGGKI